MDRQSFHNWVEKRCLLLDGSYGAQFFVRGCRKTPSEIYNLENPSVVETLQKEYVDGGADILSTNTFSANAHKMKALGYLSDIEKFNRAGVRLARRAAGMKSKVFGNISSTGEFVAPLGALSFEEAAEIFRQQASYLFSEGVEGFLLETFSDIKELKAAIMGVRSISRDVPLIVNMTFEADGRSVTGSSVESFAITIQDLDVDVIGMNCTLVPQETVPIFERLTRFARIPSCVEPNAGKPVYDGEHLSYDQSPEAFAFFANDFLELGASLIGGCCGSGPEHIRLMRGTIDRFKKRQPSEPQEETYLCSRTILSPLSPFFTIGERINPASKKTFQERIQNREWGSLLSEAHQQGIEGAKAIDLNLGIEKTLSEEHFSEVIRELDKRSSLPVSFDIQMSRFLETALREYPGRPLINSARVTEKSLESRIALLKKYGGLLILLAMGKDIPETAQERFKTAMEGVRALEENGISRGRILVDPLVLSLGSRKDPNVTLDTLSLLAQAGLKTTIGLSNLSFGLPNRSGLHAAFLSQAVERGLSAAIMNPGDENVRVTLSGALSLKGITLQSDAGIPIEDPLLKEMLEGNKDALNRLVDALLEHHPPLSVSQDYLGKSMQQLGEMYANNRIFLPQLLMAADTVREVFDRVNTTLEGKQVYIGKVLLATVEGDIHDIGKKIVAAVLRSGGFEIIDLGKDVSADEIVEEAQKQRPDIIGLSAMMTTTIGEIETVVEKLKQKKLDIPVIAGGASLNEKLALKFGCYGYGRDAVAGLDTCKRFLRERDGKS